jgi:hypothetical protein
MFLTPPSPSSVSKKPKKAKTVFLVTAKGKNQTEKGRIRKQREERKF